MMQDWFKDARLGIFIHWGIYSLGETAESWDIFNGIISQEAYNAQASKFTAAAYDPEAWASLFHAVGARYAVLTTKHHDGFALWDTRVSDWNAAAASPAGRDLVGPFVKALRSRKLHVGLYYSLSDWAHPDYATVRPSGPAELAVHEGMRSNPLAYAQGVQNEQAWNKFIRFQRAQLKELGEHCDPDLLWFDGDWERSDDQWGFEETVAGLKKWAPHAILNGRIGRFGDYSTPEQALPVVAPEGPWEFCVTLNDSWGYRTNDKNYKSSKECIELLVECAAMGGNLLLDVAPREDGVLPDEQIEVLRGLGRWVNKHEEAIFATEAGLPHGHYWGPSTKSKAGDVLYLFTPQRSASQLTVRGLMNRILYATVVGQNSTALNFKVNGGAPWADLPGITRIELPAEVCDEDLTVVRLQLDGPLRLYRGSGDKVMHNVATSCE